MKLLNKLHRIWWLVIHFIKAIIKSASNWCAKSLSQFIISIISSAKFPGGKYTYKFRGKIYDEKKTLIRAFGNLINFAECQVAFMDKSQAQFLGHAEY